MKSLFASSIVIALSLVAALAYQKPSEIKIESIYPYDTGVPGEMLELRVSGFGQGISLQREEDFEIRVSQDGVDHNATLRTITPIASRPFMPNGDKSKAQNSFTFYQSFLFTVPHGLRAGSARATLYYQDRAVSSIELKVASTPRAPAFSAITRTVLSLDSDPTSGPSETPQVPSLSFEKGSTAEILLSPLVDPDDRDAAIVAVLKQGSSVSKVEADVVLREWKGASWAAPRYAVDLKIPADVAPGKAQLELRIQANGQIGDPINLPVLIVDSSLASAFPKESAPRLLIVTPRRVGLGQAVILSIEHKRTLEPEPRNVQILIEQNGKLIRLNPEMNTAILRADLPEDAPVLLSARLPEEIIGPASIRVLNPAREGETGVSESSTIEVLNEVVAPVINLVGESTKDELEPLREMHETALRAGRDFHDYDPKSRYVTIRATGIDYNPNFVRITMAQGDRSYTLSFRDFSLSMGDLLIVREPEWIKPGSVRLTIENRGGDKYSKAVERVFEVVARDD